MKIKVVFMGTPEFALPILEVLIKETNVKMVVTQPDREVGRKKELKASPIKEMALKNNIVVFQPEKIRNDYELIKTLQPDLIVTCAYGQIVPKEVLDIPTLGCINVHASILPKYRGGAPIHHAIINGDEKTGITIMYMDEGMDTGDIIKIKELPIAKDDNVETLHNKLSILGAKLLAEVLPSIINGTNERKKQNAEEATYAKVIRREDERLDFTKSAEEVANKVRGLNSWPLANFMLDNVEIKVLEGYIGEEAKKNPGSIEKIMKDAIGISCNDKIFYMTKIKPFGKKVMLVKDYLNGVNKDNLINKQVN